MKVLVLFNAGFGDSLSGGDVHILNIIKELSKKAEVSVTFPKNAKRILKRLNKIEMIKKIALKDSKKIKGKLGLIKAYFSRAKETSKIIKKENFDLIIASTPFFCDILPLKKVSKKTKIVSYVFHTLPKRKSNSVKEGAINFLAKMQEKISLGMLKKKADLIFTSNEIEKKALERYFEGKKIKIAGIGINTSLFKRSLKKKRNSALFIGRLVKQKGIFDLVEIMKEIVKQNSKLRLKIVGEGPEKKELVKKIKEKKLEGNISLLGFVDEKKKVDLLKSSEYFFFPSYEEGFGIVIAEALYAKCKVVCYQLSHYKDFFSFFPEYIPLGKKTLFSKRYKIKRNLNAQKKYLSKFDSKRLIVEEVKKILNVA